MIILVTLLLQTVPEWEKVAEWTGHTDRVSSVVLHPDGKRAISASWDATIRTWEIASGKCLGTWKGHENRVMGLAPFGLAIDSREAEGWGQRVFSG